MLKTTEDALYAGMRHEQDRDAPPPGFPSLPLIPVGRYTDPGFLALEEKYLWKRSWLYALHADELPRVGSFRLWRKTGSPIVLVRGKDDRIRAFYNACRHRGVRLANGPGNCGKSGFVCPFHGWRWDAEGDCTFVFGRKVFSEDVLDQAEIDLAVVRDVLEHHLGDLDAFVAQRRGLFG